MAEPTKEELELMMRMILGKKYDPDFDPRKLGKREDAYVGPSSDWDPSDKGELRPDFIWKEKLQKAQEEAGPALEGSFPFLSMIPARKGVQVGRSLLKAIYRKAAKAAKPPETVMQVRKGEDYLPPVRERQATKEGIARKQRQRYNLSDELEDANFSGVSGVDKSPYLRVWRKRYPSPSTTPKKFEYIPPDIDELIKERDLAIRERNEKRFDEIIEVFRNQPERPNPEHQEHWARRDAMDRGLPLRDAWYKRTWQRLREADKLSNSQIERRLKYETIPWKIKIYEDLLKE